MLSCYELANRARHDYQRAAKDKRPQSWMLENINARFYEMLSSRTPKGRAHYTQVERQHVVATMHCCASWVMETQTLYGYWYKGEFYTTAYDPQGHKTTRVLHDMRLDQTVWQSMENGLYYADTLEPFFIG